MTDKEKEAIEHLSRFKSITIMYGKIYSMHVDQLDRLQENVDIMLKLIEKQQSEIERYKYLYQKALDNTIKSDRDNLKKDKIIDLMAEQLRTPVNSKEWVIEYYTKKVEENRKE